MPDFDLILRQGTVVCAEDLSRADIGIAAGKIAAHGSSLSGTAKAEIDASKLHIFPGVIDSHVHFNEPGRADWEGLATGSKAVAAGGGTCFFDMPLNSTPPVLDAETFAAKRSVAERESVVDFAIWGGLTPMNLDRLGELHEAGAIGLKAFMCPSGIDDFPSADAETLRRGMRIAAELGMIVAVHAEWPAALPTPPLDRRGVREFLASRPVAAELEAIRVSAEIAGETGCRLHVVHVSSDEGVALVQSYRQKGVDISCETCPHYLVLTEEDVIGQGAPAKCAPPLRPAATRDALRQSVWRGQVATIGSDHSPAPPEMKTAQDFFAVWGGISGAQHLLPLLLDLWQAHGVTDWALLARLTAQNVAERFRLGRSYGRIASGADANLALVDLEGGEDITPERLHYRHRITPYFRRKLRGKIVRTLLRGQTVACEGQATGMAGGCFVAPENP